MRRTALRREERDLIMEEIKNKPGYCASIETPPVLHAMIAAEAVHAHDNGYLRCFTPPHGDHDGAAGSSLSIWGSHDPKCVAKHMVHKNAELPKAERFLHNGIVIFEIGPGHESYAYWAAQDKVFPSTKGMLKLTSFDVVLNKHVTFSFIPGIEVKKLNSEYNPTAPVKYEPFSWDMVEDRDDEDEVGK